MSWPAGQSDPQLLEAHRRLADSYAAACVRNRELTDELIRVSGALKEARRQLAGQKTAVREARSSRDRWKRLCQGYENSMGFRRANRQPVGLNGGTR